MPAPVTVADYLKKIEGKKTVLEQVREKPDQDFSHAWSVVHNPIQDFGPMMISLANDNRKFIALREGGILFDEFDRPDNPRDADPGNIYQLDFRLRWRCVPTFGGGKDLKITRHLEGEWLPIHVTDAAEGPIVYRQTSYVAPMSEPLADAPYWYRERALCKAEYKIQQRQRGGRLRQTGLEIRPRKQKALPTPGCQRRSSWPCKATAFWR